MRYLLNNIGNVVKKVNIQIGSATETFRVPVNDIPNGFYTVKVISANNEEYSSRIMVLK